LSDQKKIDKLNSEIEYLTQFFKKIETELSDMKVEKESQDYFAHTFKLNQQKILF
jgi:hypothetical protein